MHKIESSIGNLWASPTGRDSTGCHHLYVDLGSNINVEEEGPGSTQRKGPICIRHIHYSGSVHVYQWNDGLFHVGPQFITHDGNRPIVPPRSSTQYDRRSSLYMSRIEGRAGLDDASESARKSCTEAVETAVNAWARMHQYVLEQAEDDRLQAESVKLREEISKLETEIAEKREEICSIALKLEENRTKVSSGRT